MPESVPPFSTSPAELGFDPELLAGELAEELAVDPLDALDTIELSSSDIAAECDLGLELLALGRHEDRMQGLRIFCEHRDPRAIPRLLPLLEASCPILRMSAVYALGRNPDRQAVEPLLSLLQNDSNGYVRKAVAWSLGNYPEAPVLLPFDPGPAGGRSGRAALGRRVPRRCRQHRRGQGRPGRGSAVAQPADRQ